MKTYMRMSQVLQAFIAVCQIHDTTKKIADCITSHSIMVHTHTSVASGLDRTKSVPRKRYAHSNRTGSAVQHEFIKLMTTPPITTFLYPFKVPILSYPSKYHHYRSSPRHIFKLPFKARDQCLGYFIRLGVRDSQDRCNACDAN